MSSTGHPKPLLHPQRNEGPEFSLGVPDWEDFGSLKKVQADLHEATALRVVESEWLEVEVLEEEVL